jgi:hypothetical protein
MIKKFEEFIRMNESNMYKRMDEMGMNIENFLKSKGENLNVYCFIDFSGSVEQDLVYDFLARVFKYNLNTVSVYGFGAKLSEPYISDNDSLKDNIVKSWDFIKSQKVGMHTENFVNVANEINSIKQEDRDAIFFIFGDGHWDDPEFGVHCLNTELDSEVYLDDICILTYDK